MSLVAGNSTCTTGLSKRIYDYVTADERSGFLAMSGAAQGCVHAVCYAIARAVVDEITTNADVDVTIETTDVALQRVSLVDTDGPSVARTIHGVVT